jgi:iron complex outermembrane receptor protein
MCTAFTAALLLTVWLLAADCVAGERGDPAALGDLTIEQLMNVEITSVSKREESLLEAASAIYVITGEDIRRSGVTSIPEALRMAPGIEVARINGNRWAISARGFNGEFANKLLVLMDGRTVYDPAFSGVYWDVQDTMLEDLDRIEVIRGPGATLWGANAVNGVINIITKRAADTQGLLLTAGGGTQEIGFGGVRYGGTLGTRVQYRLYAKYFDRGAQAPALGIPASDGWDVGRGGFRFEWEPSPAGTVTLQGDWYRGEEDETLVERQLTPPFQALEVAHAHVDGRNLLARWHSVFGERSDATVQAYYDHTARRDSDLGEDTDTVDLSLEHHVGLGVHDVVWGLGYRWVSDAFDNTFEAALHPTARRYDIFSGFVQDQVPLVTDRLRLTVGTKLEHNAFSGFEIQPSASLVWTPRPRHAAWVAVARAVRTPARTDRDLRFVFSTFPTENGPPGLLVAEGNRDFESEELVSYELGYRVRPWDPVFLDVAGFYDVYDDLSTGEPGAPRVVADSVPHLEFPIQFANKAHGHTYGVETALSWQVVPRWRLMLASTFLRMHIELDSSSADTFAKGMEGNSPQHQFHVRSYLNLPGNLEFDTALYYVDNLPNQGVPSHVRLDARLGWHPIDVLELSLVLQDMLHERHLEFANRSGLVEPTEIERSIYGKITLRF